MFYTFSLDVDDDDGDDDDDTQCHLKRLESFLLSFYFLKMLNLKIYDGVALDGNG